jgi:poly [ADP-ribose] polymerase
MCEVALGNMFEVGEKNEYCGNLDFLNEGYNSLKALAIQGPELSDKFVLNNGVSIPLGNIVQYQYDENEKMRRPVGYPEYIVYDSSQIRMRYLIQVN